MRDDLLSLIDATVVIITGINCFIHRSAGVNYHVEPPLCPAIHRRCEWSCKEQGEILEFTNSHAAAEPFTRMTPIVPTLLVLFGMLASVASAAEPNAKRG